MPVITVFSGSYCDGEQVSERLAEALGYELIPDAEIIARLARRHTLSEDKIRKVLYDKPSVFNRFTRERERLVAMYRAETADLLSHDGLVFFGLAGHLVPQTITHVLKVCLIADMGFRVAKARALVKHPEARIAKIIRAEDERSQEWTTFVLQREPWNPSLYDIVIPMNLSSQEQATELVLENIRKPMVQPTEQSIQAVRDFVLAARVEVALREAGHDVDIAISGSKAILTINRHVIMLSRLEAELTRIAGAVEGVEAVETKIGPDFYKSDIYRQQDFDVPSKILLVDDEQEFAQTLSERLMMREVGSAIAYDGEAALAVVEQDEPEVMVLDLKMPGIDGIEVLRRVKRDHPEVEVIILTGHGSEEDEKVCRELGAFDYLHKPVDIDALNDAMKAAYQRIRDRRSALEKKVE
jgi:CheY-like chemotaxis protein/cytidylate kinase